MIKKLANLLAKLGLIFASLIGLGFVLYLGAILFMNPTEDKYCGPQYEKDASWMIDDYASSYCKQHKMELIHVGNFTNPRSNNTKLAFWLRSYDSLLLQQARAQAVALVEDFWKSIQSDKRMLVYFEQGRRYIPVELRDKPSTMLIGVKIAYWDKEVNRPKAPAIAEMTFYDNTFHYYEADSQRQALKPVFTESYEEVMTNNELLEKGGGRVMLFDRFMQID